MRVCVFVRLSVFYIVVSLMTLRQQTTRPLCSLTYTHTHILTYLLRPIIGYLLSIGTMYGCHRISDTDCSFCCVLRQLPAMTFQIMSHHASAVM